MAAVKIDDEPAPTFTERRRQASRELMQTEILAAAQHIIRTEGMDALSLRAIARAVGVTAPALYEYFPNKDAILRAMFVQGSELMLALMEQTIEANPPGIHQLLAILGGYRQFAHDEPDYFRLLFGTVDPDLQLTETDQQSMHQLFERFISIIVGAIEQGELRPLPPMTLSCSLWALIHGVSMLENDSFMARKDRDHDGYGPDFDAAVRLTLLNFATPAGALLIEPVDDDCR